MAYPELGLRIGILQQKNKIEPSAVADGIDKDKTTAWRWLQNPGRLAEAQQDVLVNAICKVMNGRGVAVSPDTFRISNLLDFCREIGVPKLEAATMTGRLVPVPDVFVDSVFHPASNRKAFVGSYLAFRHDKNKERREKPYLQSKCQIAMDGHDRLTYEESWVGETGIMVVQRLRDYRRDNNKFARTAKYVRSSGSTRGFLV